MNLINKTLNIDAYSNWVILSWSLVSCLSQICYKKCVRMVCHKLCLAITSGVWAAMISAVFKLPWRKPAYVIKKKKRRKTTTLWLPIDDIIRSRKLYMFHKDPAQTKPCWPTHLIVAKKNHMLRDRKPYKTNGTIFFYFWTFCFDFLDKNFSLPRVHVYITIL